MLLLSCWVACKKDLKEQEYVSYINDKNNGLKKVIQIDGWEFEMQYRPYDYIALLENKNEVSDSVSKDRIAQLKGTAWFSIMFKRIDNQITPLRYGVSSIDEYNDRLNYYLNHAIADIKLLYGKDTLYPKSYLFENNYNLTPQETMIVGFYLPDGDSYPQKKMRLSFFDRIFKNGIINAQYPASTLNHIPNLVN